MNGFSKILAQEFHASLPEKARHFIDRIRDASGRMGVMIDELLELSRIGRRDLSLQVTGLSSLVQQVLADLPAEANPRHIEWRVAELPFIACDPALMRHVFANLIANAVKFTRPRPTAVIEIGRVFDGDRQVIFVRDNGVGFNMKCADKLFGVFQRLHRPEDFEGTGVGLALVERIVHKHGGRIWVQAEEDRGATFYFTVGPPPPHPEPLEKVPQNAGEEIYA